MQTNKQLQLAYDFVQNTGENIFLTGKAGTGKTTFLKSLKQRSPKRMVVVAPTGVAAINAGGVTIHSFFQLSFAPQIGTGNNENTQKRFTKEKINIIRSLDLLVIDEVSMVRADIMDAIDRVLRRFKNRNKPFGGAQVLMIGDLQQLSPVIKKEEWEILKTEYDTGYFFSSKVLKNTPYISIELIHVFRQRDDHFIAILNKVRDNCLDKPSLDALNQRFIPRFSPPENEGYITLCTHNAHAGEINSSKLQKLPSKTRIFKAETGGMFPEYSYPTDFELPLKPGAQVMFVKNDPEADKRFFNGKIGKITSIDDDSVFVQCPGETDEIEVTPLEWENIKYSIDPETAEIKEEVEGTFIQLPLKLAWAITIHKSQGLTFEKAVIDAEASFAHGQVYVALSRCKTLEGMVLSTPITNNSIITDNTVGGFIKQVEENQPGENELNIATLNYQKELVSDLFKFGLIVYLTNAILKLADENRGSFPEILIKNFQSIAAGLQTEMVEIADKFLIQVESLLATEPNISLNLKLQDRISKASDYFRGKIKTIVIKPLKDADLDIDNRALKKQLKNAVTGILEDAETKIAVFEACLGEFSIKNILDAKAKSHLDVKPDEPKTLKEKQSPASESIAHPLLYNLLRSWRYEMATQIGNPVYMVFSQKALIEMANYLPVTIAALKQINGFGQKKVEQFGDEITQIIQHYCDENNVEPAAIPTKKGREKEKKPKVDTKHVSFELFQSGKTITEIAQARQLTATTIESHLAFYVGLGKLEVTQFLSHQKLEKIISYFKTAENKSFIEAKIHFSDTVSYGEMRIALSYIEFQGKEKMN